MARRMIIIKRGGILVLLVLEGEGGRMLDRVGIVPEGDVPILALYNSIHIILKYFIVVVRKYKC